MELLLERDTIAPAAASGGERGDWTIDQQWDRYTAQEHLVWKTLYERQASMLAGRACDAFLAGMRALSIGSSGIPDFRRLSELLIRQTGWQVVAVPGLVPDEVFFEHLAKRQFPAGQFIRKPEQLDYLQEPDVFHDVFGHVPLLTNPVIADYLQAYGVAALQAKERGVLALLARVYWYTIEFGLVEQKDGLRLYGAGIVSSYAESLFALDSASPNRIRFRLPRVMQTDYRIDDFQETYFVIRDLDELLALAHTDFAPLYAQVRGLEALQPRAVLPDDVLLNAGTGTYHRARI
ncbi:phenylalanine 4-monooxygenase [Massilia niabensis]|uniref:Phenylalanine-4-hydroxylase n=1 Tax=Massilia niabensis TaxID=544910 RepID=A0ABW0L983_9BURK